MSLGSGLGLGIGLGLCLGLGLDPHPGPNLHQAEIASKAQGSDADQAELTNARRALANSQAALANAQAALADAQASDPHKDAAAAAKRMQEVLAGQAIQFDGAGNKARYTGDIGET